MGVQLGLRQSRGRKSEAGAPLRSALLHCEVGPPTVWWLLIRFVCSLHSTDPSPQPANLPPTPPFPWQKPALLCLGFVAIVVAESLGNCCANAFCVFLFENYCKKGEIIKAAVDVHVIEQKWWGRGEGGGQGEVPTGKWDSDMSLMQL